MITALICGGRDYSNRDRLFAVLDKAVHKLGIERIVEGGATGADMLAREFAVQRDLSIIEIHADWASGPKAGPIRNMQMLAQKPDYVIAFPGNAGTAHMVMIAEKGGFTVHRIDWQKVDA